MLRAIQKHGITLALLAADSTGPTVAVNQMIRATIAEQASLQQKALFDQVLPVERYNNALAQSRHLVTALELGKGEHRVHTAKQDDKPAVVILEATVPDGYSGAIQLLVGADLNDTVFGTYVTEHHETLGLGDKTELRPSGQITHFVGKKISGADDTYWAVRKDGGDFDQLISVAVIPCTVVNAAKHTGLYAQMLPTQLSQLPAHGEQSTSETGDVIVQGLWKDSSALVQLLGLYPLLAITSTATNALGLGLVATLVLTLINLITPTLRHRTSTEVHILIYVTIIASVASAVQMLINAYALGPYQSLEILISLIATNCIAVGHAEAFAAKKSPALSTLGGSSVGMGAACAMFMLGSLCEVIGNGTLFDDADALSGSWTKVLRMEIFHADSPFLLVMLPPGTFIGPGPMLVGKYLIDEGAKKHRAEATAECVLPNGGAGNV